MAERIVCFRNQNVYIKIIMKQTIGITKPIAIFFSPMAPMSTGAIAPPTMDMIRNEEARFVFALSKPLIARANMVGNIMDSKR